MKILAIGDFHGKNILDLKQICSKEKIDLILCPGDVSYMDKIREIMFANYTSRKKWYNIIGKPKAKQLIQESVEKGVAILEELNRIGVPVYFVPGNAELTGRAGRIWAYLKQNFLSPHIEQMDNIYFLDFRKRAFGEYNIIGYGDNNSGPEIDQYEKVSKEKLARQNAEYDKIHKNVSKLFLAADKPIIFLTHNVPFNTLLDKITSPAAPESVRGKHYGSLIVKDMIEKYQPCLCVGGHMHENQGVIKIGKTKVVNCGFGAKGEYAIINITQKQVKVKLLN